jgi:hypothetical protein
MDLEANSSGNGRKITMYTSRQGMKQFDLAMKAEFTSQVLQVEEKRLAYMRSRPKGNKRTFKFDK